MLRGITSTVTFADSLNDERAGERPQVWSWQKKEIFL